MLKDFGQFLKEKGNEYLREGVMIKFTLEEFSNIISPQLLESEDRSMIVENAYSFYEMGILHEQNKSWFSDESPIYSMTGDLGTILFKNESMFIISERTMQAINEGVFGDLSDGWERVKSEASQSYSQIKGAAKDQWDLISAGAKKAISFGSKIIAATKAFVTEKPLNALVIGLQILSIGAAFLPPPFNLIAPSLLAISGGIDVYHGIHEIMVGWEKVKDLDLSKGEKIKNSLVEGLPEIVSGSIAVTLGLTELIEAPEALLGSGVGSIAAKKAAHAWESKFLGKFASKYNNIASAIIKDKGVLKIAEIFGKDLGKLTLKAGNSLMSVLVTTIMAHCGKEILGEGFDVLLSGVKNVGKFIKFLMEVPKNISSQLNAFIINANKSDSAMVKIVASALSTFVAPFLKILSTVINATIKPILDRVANYMISVGTHKDELERIGETLGESGEAPLYQKSQPKAQEKYDTNKDDMKYIKKIGVIDNGKLVFPGLTTEPVKPWSFKEEGQVKNQKK